MKSFSYFKQTKALKEIVHLDTKVNIKMSRMSQTLVRQKKLIRRKKESYTQTNAMKQHPGLQTERKKKIVASWHQ